MVLFFQVPFPHVGLPLQPTLNENYVNAPVDDLEFNNETRTNPGRVSEHFWPSGHFHH